MSKGIESYALIRAWGLQMGSSGYYIDDQQAHAKQAGAPQTALYYRRADQPMVREGRQTWTDPATGDVWALWDELMPTTTVGQMKTVAIRMGTTLEAMLAAAGYVALAEQG